MKYTKKKLWESEETNDVKVGVANMKTKTFFSLFFQILAQF